MRARSILPDTQNGQHERTDMGTKLGIIEGFYGLPWGFDTRVAYIPFMQQYNYGFYLYAPKADPYLREEWNKPAPPALLDKLKSMGEQFQEAGIKWGVGLSPFDLHQDFHQQGKQNLKRKLAELESIGCEYLAILFDDMKGDFPELAKTQIEICEYVQQNAWFEHLMMCPSYYSFDPVLEKVFGKMPENYLEDLGEDLDQSFDIFWTGELVCSTSYSQPHLKEVEQLLKRKPLIWDNYPVNDGARMSPFLHLSPFEGREACVNLSAGIVVNPMNEAWLSQIPLSSLDASLRTQQGGQAWEQFLAQALGDAAEAFLSDLKLFESRGLNELSEAATCRVN